MGNALLIAQICSGISALSWCPVTVEAVGKQTGAYQSIEFIEKGSMRFATDKARYYIGDKAVELAAYPAAIYAFAQGREARFNFRSPIFSDRLELSGSKTGAFTNFVWNF